MPEIWEIGFKGNRREPHVNTNGLSLAVEDYVIVQADRGEDLGRIWKRGPVLPAEKITLRDPNEPKKGGLRTIVRKATDDDLRVTSRIRDEEREAYKIAKDRIAERKLGMNLVDVEEQFDGNRITFYFTAERRVDFRELVKDLASIFKTRIELRQIGVRDEAKRLGGIGVCGRELCCSTWMVEFIPVTLKHAKEQSLSLSPSKLSGLCGRLKCCLTYETDFYRAAKREYPKVGTRTRIAGMEVEVTRVDYFKEWIHLRDAEGKDLVIDVALYHQRIAKGDGEAGGCGGNGGNGGSGGSGGNGGGCGGGGGGCRSGGACRRV
jgi:cell fate regulator YaaT (PSP1 superfamily)